MNKTAISAIVALGVLAGPAQAHKGEKPDKTDKPAKAKSCKVKKGAFVLSGTYVSGTLTQTQGAATTTDRSDDRYSGSVTIRATKGNRHARSTMAERTVTLTDARVKFADRNGDGTADQPVAGDRVKLQGKATRQSRKCSASGFTPTVSIRKVTFKAPKADDDSKDDKSGKDDKDDKDDDKDDDRS